MIHITGTGILAAPGNLAQSFENALEGNANSTERSYGSGKSAFNERVYEIPDALVEIPESYAHFDRSVALALAAAHSAVAEAKLVAGERTGVYIGISRPAEHARIEANDAVVHAKEVPRDSLMRTLSSGTASAISKTFDARGGSMTMNAACASSLIAMGVACDKIRLGAIENAISGGVESPLSATFVGQHHALGERGTLSKSGALKPFDENRDGTIFAEAAGLFVLESETSTVRRGSKTIARILGYASANDQGDLGNDKTGEALERAVRGALEMAHLRSKEIELIYAHGTGTRTGDRTEGLALSRIFPHRPAITSLKWLFGHCNGASGAIELALGIYALRQRIFLPNILTKPDLKCGDLNLPTKPLKTSARILLKTVSGFGGAHAAMVLSVD